MRKTFTLLLTIFIFTGLNAQVILFEEDFENGMPSTFTLIDVDGNTPHSSTPMFTDAWIALTDPLNSSNTIAASTSYYDPAGQADDWMITPPINIGTSAIVRWSSASYNTSSNINPNGYEVYISTTGTNITDFTDMVFNIVAETADWKKRSADLSNYAGQTIYIAWRNNTNDGFFTAIDSIEVTGDPASVNNVDGDKFEVSISPNPTASLTNIEIILTNNSNVEVILYDITGQQIDIIANENMHRGTNNVTYLGSKLASGVYFVKVKTEESERVTRLVISR